MSTASRLMERVFERATPIITSLFLLLISILFAVSLEDSNEIKDYAVIPGLILAVYNFLLALLRLSGILHLISALKGEKSECPTVPVLLIDVCLSIFFFLLLLRGPGVVEFSYYWLYIPLAVVLVLCLCFAFAGCCGSKESGKGCFGTPDEWFFYTAILALGPIVSFALLLVKFQQIADARGGDESLQMPWPVTLLGLLAFTGALFLLTCIWLIVSAVSKPGFCARYGLFRAVELAVGSGLPLATTIMLAYRLDTEDSDLSWPIVFLPLWVFFFVLFVMSVVHAPRPRKETQQQRQQQPPLPNTPLASPPGYVTQTLRVWQNVSEEPKVVVVHLPSPRPEQQQSPVSSPRSTAEQKAASS